MQSFKWAVEHSNIVKSLVAITLCLVFNGTQKPVPGLYFLDSTASERVESIIPSARGELEITDLLESYLSESALEVELLGRGFSWLDTGTHDSLIEASEFVKTVQKRQGFSVGCPEEVALLKGWINKEKLEERLKNLPSNNYSNYLRSLLK